MQNIINSGNIISYDDMMYNSGPTKFNSFINDEYNKVHIELYNDALSKYYNWLLHTNIDNEFFFNLFTIMRNNFDNANNLHKAIMNSTNAIYVRKALIELCANTQTVISKIYDIVSNYLYTLKNYLINGINNESVFIDINDPEDIRDFTIAYLDTSIFIKPEDDEEEFDYEFDSFTLNSDFDSFESHNFYMSELSDYVFILENETGVRIGFNRKGKWIILLNNETKYKSFEIMKTVLAYLVDLNKKLFKDIEDIIFKAFHLNHRILETRGEEYWHPSSIIIISKIPPYNKKEINLYKWWNNSYANKNMDISNLKLTKDNIEDSEVIGVNYVNGTAKLYSKSNDLTYEVPFKYLNELNNIGDDMMIINTFMRQL